MAATITAIPDAQTVSEEGLLTDEEVAGVLRGVLGPAVPEAELLAAAAALRAAAAAKWELLPPGIHPDMGFNYDFLSCTETCWLGRQILVEGATFRIFKQRSDE